MRTKHLWRALTLLLCALSFIGCSNDDEEGRKVTDYKELVLTVASNEVPGVLLNGHNFVSEVYAVKKEQTDEWIAYGNIAGFEYEKGYEYKIKVSETTYLDYTIGDPSCTERELLEVISKDKKESEDLPLHLVPEIYYKHIPLPRYRYAVEAENKSLIEDDLKTSTLLPLDCHYLYYSSEGDFLKWIGIQDKNSVFGPYIVKNTKKPEEMPESYKLLPPEGRIVGNGIEWTFLDESENPVNPLIFDVFIGYAVLTKSTGPTPDTLFLYKDLTQFYQSKYPNAGVKTVVASYTLRTTAAIQ
ncbi:DUF4377 domain-containing protein [Phocaeicola vulgatus]|uniref:DUF4377 domain-containing protein n=1 Tax=Phocaeicola vulgatus TaxID=821 RepID=UPI003567A229